MKCLHAFVAMLVIAGLASVSQGSSLVVNGGFDVTPHVDNGFTSLDNTTAYGWTGVTDPGQYSAIYDPNSTRMASQNGTNDIGYLYAAGATSAALQQTVGMTLTNNTRYTLTVQVGADSYFNPNLNLPLGAYQYPFPTLGNGVSTGDVFARLLANGGTMPGFLAGSSTIIDPTLNHGYFATWTLVWQTGANEPLAGATLTVDLSTSNNDPSVGGEVFFDNVVLTAPEPASLSLLGVGSIFALRRTKRTRVA